MTEKRKPIVFDFEPDALSAQNFTDGSKLYLNRAIPSPEEALAIAQDIAAKSGLVVKVVSARDVHPDILIDDRMENVTSWPEHNMVTGGTDISKAMEAVLKMREQNFNKPDPDKSSENKPK